MTLTGSGAVGEREHGFFAFVTKPLSGNTFRQMPAGILAQEWTTEARSEWRGPTSDEELIKRRLRSQSTASAFGGRASFADLWTANIDALSARYPTLFAHMMPRRRRRTSTTFEAFGPG